MGLTAAKHARLRGEERTSQSSLELGRRRNLREKSSPLGPFIVMAGRGLATASSTTIWGLASLSLRAAVDLQNLCGAYQ